jgi:hypothetical protein
MEDALADIDIVHLDKKLKVAEYKRCSNVNCKLSQPLPLTDFSKCNSKADGLQHACKTCTKLYKKHYCNSTKGFMVSLIDSAKANNNTRNLTGRNLEFNLTLEHIMAKWEQQQGRCAITGQSMSLQPHSHFKCSIERLNNDIGYTDKNTVLIISECNTSSQWTVEKAAYLFDTVVHERVQFADDQLQAPPRPAQTATSSMRKWVVNADGTVYCHKCCVTKPRTHFASDLKRGCKVCQANNSAAYRSTWWGALQELYGSARNRSKKRGMEFPLKFEQLVNILKRQGGLCFYSGVPMTCMKGAAYKMSIERLDPAITYIDESSCNNVALICQEFNSFDCTRRKTAESNDGCAGWSTDKYATIQTIFNQRISGNSSQSST